MRAWSSTSEPASNAMGRPTNNFVRRIVSLLPTGNAGDKWRPLLVKRDDVGRMREGFLPPEASPCFAGSMCLDCGTDGPPSGAFGVGGRRAVPGAWSPAAAERPQLDGW